FENYLMKELPPQLYQYPVQLIISQHATLNRNSSKLESYLTDWGYFQKQLRSPFKFEHIRTEGSSLFFSYR
ncbi:unnamed protein product, partial [Ceratitis capitata]